MSFPTIYGQSVAGKYHEWEAPFRGAIDKALRPGMCILDVGAGRRPVLMPEERPPCCQYRGLDIAQSELEAAPSGSYDDVIVADISTHRPELLGSVDLIISWQVLEHVKPLDAAFKNMRLYLRSGGRIVVFFSGSYSIFGLVNRTIPHRFGRRIVARAMGRDPESVFPAPYHRCHARALRQILADWSDSTIVGHWRGADYLSSVPRIQRAYLRFERWAAGRGYEELATHYLVVATK